MEVKLRANRLKNVYVIVNKGYEIFMTSGLSYQID